MKRNLKEANSKQTPNVCVLIPVHNGGLYLRKAIQSIVAGDFADFEILVVDDGSTDESAKIALEFPDSRVRVHCSALNRGIASALNTGLALTEAKYIARLDSDDLAAPSRLRRQLEFLLENPSVGLVSSWVGIFGSKTGIRVAPRNHRDITAEMIWRNPLVHSSVMFDLDILKANKLSYRKDFEPCEDFDLWQRLSIVTEFAVIPELLTYHRVHAGQVTKESGSATREFVCRNTIRSRHREGIRTLSRIQRQNPLSHSVSDKIISSTSLVARAFFGLLSIGKEKLIQGLRFPFEMVPEEAN